MINSISYVKTNLHKIVDSIQVSGEPFAIYRSKQGPVAVILDINEYRALKAVRRLVEQDPERLLELDAAYEKARSGQLRGKRLDPDPLAEVVEPGGAVVASG